MTATITLYGPPPESSININGRLAFYWAYAKPLLPGQQFILTLRQNDNVFTTQAIAAPNFGSGFQRMVDLADLPLEPGTAVWQLHLEWQDEKLLASEERTIILLPE